MNTTELIDQLLESLDKVRIADIPNGRKQELVAEILIALSKFYDVMNEVPKDGLMDWMDV